jgi:hypothetical protein
MAAFGAKRPFRWGAPARLYTRPSVGELRRCPVRSRIVWPKPGTFLRKAIQHASEWSDGRDLTAQIANTKRFRLHGPFARADQSVAAKLPIGRIESRRRRQTFSVFRPRRDEIWSEQPVVKFPVAGPTQKRPVPTLLWRAGATAYHYWRAGIKILARYRRWYCRNLNIPEPQERPEKEEPEWHVLQRNPDRGHRAGRAPRITEPRWGCRLCIDDADIGRRNPVEDVAHSGGVR